MLLLNCGNVFAEIVDSSSNKTNSKFSIGFNNSYYFLKEGYASVSGYNLYSKAFVEIEENCEKDCNETINDNGFYIYGEESLDDELFLGFYFSYVDSKKIMGSVFDNNLYLKYRFNNGNKFRPFIGIGGGLRYVVYDNDAIGKNIDSIINDNDPSVNGKGTSTVDMTGSFYGNIIAGFEYQFAKKFSLEFSARYDLNTQNYKQKGIHYNYPYDFDHEFNYDSKQLSFNIGLVYSFDYVW